MDEINNKLSTIKSIADLNNKELVEEIFKEIRELPNVEEQREACELYVKTAKTLITDAKFTKQEEVIGWVSGIRADLALANLSTETIDEIFARNGFDAKELLDSKEEEKSPESKAEEPEKTEIEQIEEEIKKGVNPAPKQPVAPPSSHAKKEIEHMTEYIQHNLPEGITTIEQVEEEIKQLEKEKSEKMKAIDAEIAKLSTTPTSSPEDSSTNESSTSSEEDLESELTTLENEVEALVNKATHSGKGLTDEEEKLLDEKNKRIETIENELTLITKYANRSDEELENELNGLLNIKIEPENPELDAQLNAIQQELERRETEKYLELTDEMETMVIGRISIEDEQFKKVETEISKIQLEKETRKKIEFSKQIEQDLKKEIESLKVSDFMDEAREMANKMNLRGPQLDKYIEITAETLYKKEVNNLQNEIKKLQTEREELKQRHKLDENNPLANKTTEELEQMFNVLKEEKKSNENNKTAELEAKINELKAELDRRKKQKNKNPESTKTAEKNDNKEKISELENEKLKIQSSYDKKIQTLNNVKLLMEIRDAYLEIQKDAITALEGEKIKEEELIDRIKEYIEKHEKFPVLDKYKTINKNTPKLKDELINDIANRLRTKKPEKPKQDKKLLWKGLAGVAGFVAGFGLSAVPGIGTIRMVTAGTKLAVNLWTKKFPEGKVAKFISNIDEKLEKSESGFMQKINAVKNLLKNPYVNYFTNGLSAGYLAGNAFEFFTGRTWAEYFGLKDNPIGMIVDPVDKVPVRTPLELQPGQELDLSSLGQGYSYEGALDSHSILEYAGEQAKFDRMVEVDGQRWYHFLQGANAKEGAGYSWFTEEQIQQAIDAAKAAGKGR